MKGGQMAEFYLVNLASPGLGKLCDGPHSDRAGVEKALYLHRSLGLVKGAQYACAEVTPVEAKAHGANEEAISACNVMFHDI